MKKITSLMMIALFILPMLTIAQDEVKRPKNIGVADFDNFKNSAFDIQEESSTLRSSVEQIDGEVKNYSGTINTIGIDKLKSNYSALKDSKGAVATITQRLTQLDDQSKSLLEKAKNFKPKMKSISATKNTNASIQGLGKAKEDLKAVGTLLDEDIKIISDELKSRGEPIE